MRIYTRKGDDGTTGLLGGGRVDKADPVVEVNGTLDEAQAFLGLARAECEPGSDLDGALVEVESDLWVLMGELALAPEASEALRKRLDRVTPEMVARLEARIDQATADLDLEAGFAVPGDNRRSAALDVARTVVRRAERLACALPGAPAPALAYLNRLSDLCWALARASEQHHAVQRRRPTDAARPPTDPEERP